MRKHTTNETLGGPLEALVPINRQAATEGIVLLENKGGVLPLGNRDTVSIFGRCQIDTYRSGTGSGGAVNVPYAVSILDGLRNNESIHVNEDLVSVYREWLKDNPFDDGGGGWAAEPWCQQEMPITDQTARDAAAQSNKALVILGRTAGEDMDYSNGLGSYQLTNTERDMIVQVASCFEDVIIVLNTTNIIDLSWLGNIDGRSAIKGVLFCWAGGIETGNALADVLSGRASPSGKLADTIACDLEAYPSSTFFGHAHCNCYGEDIYVGYRHFETFQPDAVLYPFGFGLSYTSFQFEQATCTQEESDASSQLHFRFKVRNAGEQYSSKEVIQLYCEAPQGHLGKPSRVLIGFEKTRTLAPGEAETVDIVVPLSSLASYDDSGTTCHKSSYVLEQGDYLFYAGSNVRDASRMGFVHHQTELLVIDAVNEAMAPVRAFDRMKPGLRKHDGTYELTWEPVPQSTRSLSERIESTLPKELPLTGDQGITLSMVKEGKVNIDTFVAQLTPEDIATLVLGEGMCHPMVTPGTAAAFGGVSERLRAFGIPVAAASDGPSGIRMDSGHKATQVPIGTLLACTWNRKLNEELFSLVGQELVSYRIDTLLGPGINIHRHPLNGRNFEYFSEDPVLTGEIASAQTRGLSRAGVVGTIKHFAANDQETNRHNIDSVVSERALREIHLKPFEIACKHGKASSIMTAYNPINGHWSASNYDLTTTILRNEWGYTGIVMTDWWAKMNHPVKGGKGAKESASYMIRAQNDLYMVVGNLSAETSDQRRDILEALNNGDLTLAELQRSAINICRFLTKTATIERPIKPYDPFKAFSPLLDPVAEHVLSLQEEIILNASTPLNIMIRVQEDADYAVSALCRYDAPSLAQSACRLDINGIYAGTLSTNGTSGEEKIINAFRARLRKGDYQLDIEFIKTGMELLSLIFETK